MKILMFIVLFFALSALLIISNNDLAFYKSENIKTFSGLYFEWLNGVYVNFQTITGNVVELDWFPENQNS